MGRGGERWDDERRGHVRFDAVGVGMRLWRAVGTVLSWDNEDYRRLCCLTWSTSWLWSGWRSLTLGVGWGICLRSWDTFNFLLCSG